MCAPSQGWALNAERSGAEREAKQRASIQTADVSSAASPSDTRWSIRQMDTLTAFGLFAVTAMLATYALEERHRGFILAFAGSCALGSIYGFLQGAWPFGLVEAIWALVAVRRWWQKGY